MSCSVTQLCMILCDFMDCNTPGFPVLHYLQEFAQTHVRWVGDAIQPSHPLSSPLLLTSIFPSIRVFSNESDLHIRWPKYWSFSFSMVLPMNTQGWFPLGLVWSPCCPKDSQESFPAPQFENINSSALSLLYGPTLTFVYDYWKNHGFDYVDFVGTMLFAF